MAFEITPLLNHHDYLLIIGRCEEEKYAYAVEVDRLKKENQLLKEEIKRTYGKLESTNSNEQLS